MTQELQTLSLMNNRITEYSQLEPLTKLEKLIQLDLSECPIAREPEYRGKLFSMFSHLEILDNKDVDNQSVDYDEEGDAELAEGEFGEEEEYDDEGDEEDFNEDEDEEDSDAARPSKKLKK